MIAWHGAAHATGWLDSRHSFYFGGYQDPAHMGFRALRVINEDRVSPAPASARTAIATWKSSAYVLEGALEHKDSIGNGTVIRPGDVQRMSAGTGIEHSEFNPSPTSRCICCKSGSSLSGRSAAELRAEGVSARAASRQAAPRRRAGWQDGAVALHEDARLFVANLESGSASRTTSRRSRCVAASGARHRALNDTEMREGDGAAIEGEPRFTIEAGTDAEILLFDLA